MNPPRPCPQCGAPVPAGAPGGQCPVCLLGVATLDDEGGRPPAGGAESLPPQVRHFGDYELLGEIARGGMGIVYRARHASLGRWVALKMIATGALASRDAVARFHTEAAAAARLEHPNIVPVHETGEIDGRHFLAMKLVEGASLAELARLGPFGARRAAEVVAKVARAVAHAHERGVLHRDLKPGNILCDAQGEPHVTDFGLARLADRPGEVTGSGAILGSPSYMSPEQASGRAGDVTVAADVYGLGAVLYELLAGRPPFTGPTALEILRKVLHEEPPRPRAIEPGADRDLEVIALKCLEKDPARRYASAREVAEDLERWLGHAPIRARRSGPVERLGKWCLRRPAVAALSLALVALVIAGVGGMAWQWRKAEAALVRAEQSARDALSAAAPSIPATRVLSSDRPGRWTLLAPGPGLLLGEVRTGDPEGLAAWSLGTGAWLHDFPGLTGTVTRAALSASGERLVTLAADEPSFWRPRTRTGQAWHEMHDGRVFSAAGGAGDRMEVWETRTGRRVARLQPPGALPPSLVLALDAGGSRAATGHADGQVHLWDATQGIHLRRLRPHDTAVQWLEFSPDGSLLVSCSAGWRGQPAHSAVVFDPVLARLHRVADGSEAGELRNSAGFWRSLGRDARAEQSRAHFDPDGRRLVVWSRHAGNTGIWDIGRSLWLARRSPGGPAVRMAGFAGRGRWAAFGQESGDIELWDAATGVRQGVLKGHRRAITLLEPGPGDDRLLSGSDDADLRVWDLPSRVGVSVLRGHEGHSVNALASGPSDVVSTSDDGTLRHWSALTVEQAAPRLAGHRGRITALTFTPDGRRLVSGADDGTVRVWDAGDGRLERTFKEWPGLAPEWFEAAAGPIQEVLAGPNGDWVAVSGALSQLRIRDGFLPSAAGKVVDLRPVCFLDLEGGTVRQSIEAGEWGAGQLVLAPDGRRAAVLEGRIGRRVVITSEGRRRGDESRPRPPDIRPAFHIHDVATGRRQASVAGCGMPHRDAAAFSPDGAWFVVADGPELRIHGLGQRGSSPGIEGGESAMEERMLHAPGGESFWGVGFDRGGRWLAVRRGEHAVDVLDTRDWSVGTRFEHGTNIVAGCWFRRNGDELVAWTVPGGLVRHDVATGRELGRMAGFRPQHAVFGLGADERVFAVGQGRQVVVLDVEAGQETGRFGGHLAALSAVAVQGDGTRIASGDAEGLIRLWNARAGPGQGATRDR